jgi:hypothetical protein
MVKLEALPRIYLNNGDLDPNRLRFVKSDPKLCLQQKAFKSIIKQVRQR